jgi:hypothetical protein
MWIVKLALRHPWTCIAITLAVMLVTPPAIERVRRAAEHPASHATAHRVAGNAASSPRL